MGLKTADGKQNFKHACIFKKFKLSSPSGILQTLLALYAILGLCMLYALKGVLKSFAIALKAIRDPLQAEKGI
jgi:hypothetical protein